MKAKLIATVTDYKNPGFLEFKRSLDAFKWDYEFLNGSYKAFGSKAINAYQYAKKTDCTHLFIVDAYDMFVLGDMQTALDRINDKDIILFNAEKGCWPDGEKAVLYPECSYAWKYLNGGGIFASTERFIKFFEENPIKHLDNDQRNYSTVFLQDRDKYKMKLDTDCDIFQSIAFEERGEFFYDEGRLFNLKTRTFPILIHGNGKTDMSHIYKLL